MWNQIDEISRFSSTIKITKIGTFINHVRVTVDSGPDFFGALKKNLSLGNTLCVLSLSFINICRESIYFERLVGSWTCWDWSTPDTSVQLTQNIMLDQWWAVSKNYPLNPPPVSSSQFNSLTDWSPVSKNYPSNPPPVSSSQFNSLTDWSPVSKNYPLI